MSNAVGTPPVEEELDLTAALSCLLTGDTGTRVQTPPTLAMMEAGEPTESVDVYGVGAGLGHTVAPHHRASTLYQIHWYIQCRLF